MSHKRKIYKPVRVFEYKDNNDTGIYIPLSQIPENTEHFWAKDKGGGKITSGLPVTYGTKMPNGDFAHGGVFVNYNGKPKIFYHYSTKLPIHDILQ